MSAHRPVHEYDDYYDRAKLTEHLQRQHAYNPPTMSFWQLLMTHREAHGLPAMPTRQNPAYPPLPRY